MNDHAPPPDPALRFLFIVPTGGGLVSDRRERLVKLRDQQEAALDGCSPEMLPQLSGQYRATLTEIDGIDAAVGGDEMRDDLRVQRQRRLQKRRTG